MKFKLTPVFLAWLPVVVPVPDPEKPGHTKHSTFEAEFELLPADVQTLVEAEIQASEDGKNVLSGEVAFIKRVMKNWRDIQGDDDGDLPFTPENVHAALQHAFVRRAIFEAYWPAVRGDGARLGN